MRLIREGSVSLALPLVDDALIFLFLSFWIDDDFDDFDDGNV